MAIFVFLVAQAVGVIKLGPVGYFKKKFLLPGAPWWVQFLAVLIMPIVLLAEPFSLAVRLFANMTAGHKVLVTFAVAELVGGVWLWQSGTWQKLVAVLPFALSVVLLAFELFVAFIQAFIFTLLSALYLSESLEEHH
jgi:F-type H+-transporting ATPase subunit a